MRGFTLLLLASVLQPATAAAHADAPRAAAETAKGGVQPGMPLPAWTPGELDIHHISTGSGNATYFVLPDGTTMLFDAGDVDRQAMTAYAPLKLQDPRPDGTRRPGQWIADYVRQFTPRGRPAALDYALISHFHSDHFGKLLPTSPASRVGPYKLTGIMDVAELVPIGTLIDRAAPDYAFPVELRACSPGKASTMSNYIAFVDQRLRSGKPVRALVPGRLDQIALLTEPKRYPDFHVRNVAASGVAWTGDGERSVRLVPPQQAGGCMPDENPLSLALKITYGSFNYYTGGDNTGIVDPGQPAWRDVESRIAAVVGPVDAMLLDHHGNRDSTNATMLAALRPRVIVQETWVSDQPGGEVVQRMTNKTIWPGDRDIFSTAMLPETRIAIGPWMERNYASFNGHVVIRVAPGGASYDVYVLEDGNARRLVKTHFGPYRSR